MVEETHRNVQLTMGIQSLQSRITAMERSAGALRELLRQRMGEQGLLQLMEALEALGAGSNALLEVSVSKSAHVVLDKMMGPNDVADTTEKGMHHQHQQNSQEDRRIPRGISGNHPYTRVDHQPSLVSGRRGWMGGVDESKGGDRLLPPPRRAIGREQEQEEGHRDLSNPYNKAIEDALYR